MQSKLPHTRLANAFTGLKLKAGSNTPKVASADGGLPASKSITSRLRFLRPRQATVLSGIKITATIAGKVGAAAPVPVIQPIADGVKQIVDYCEVCALCLKKRVDIQPMVFLLDGPKAQEGMHRTQGPRSRIRGCPRAGNRRHA